VRRYLLDTTPLAAYLFGRPAARSRFDPWLANDELATSVLAYAEVVEYLRGQPDFPIRYRSLRELLTAVYPYSLTYSILDRYSVIRRQLRSPIGPGLIGGIDTLLAATAIEHNLTIVTCDMDYARVPGLRAVVIPRDDFRH
jgi:predicted nucleic acid-binding protein